MIKFFLNRVIYVLTLFFSAKSKFTLIILNENHNLFTIVAKISGVASSRLEHLQGGHCRRQSPPYTGSGLIFVSRYIHNASHAFTMYADTFTMRADTFTMRVMHSQCMPIHSQCESIHSQCESIHSQCELCVHNVCRYIHNASYAFTMY